MTQLPNKSQWVRNIALVTVSSIHSLAEGLRRGMAEFQKACADIMRHIGGNDDGDGPCPA